MQSTPSPWGQGAQQALPAQSPRHSSPGAALLLTPARWALQPDRLNIFMWGKATEKQKRYFLVLLKPPLHKECWGQIESLEWERCHPEPCLPWFQPQGVTSVRSAPGRDHSGSFGELRPYMHSWKWKFLLAQVVAACTCCRRWQAFQMAEVLGSDNCEV